jgi:hypothetical protein
MPDVPPLGTKSETRSATRAFVTQRCEQPADVEMQLWIKASIEGQLDNGLVRKWSHHLHDGEGAMVVTLAP